MTTRGRGRRSIFRSPLVLLSAAALLAALLVLLAAPFLRFGETAPFERLDLRLGIVLLIAIAWGACALLVQSRRADASEASDGARRREEESASARLAETAAADGEIAAIRHNARFAVRRLRAGMRREFLHPRIYRLPWYLVIGPKGSGKSALVAASGLEFPFGMEAPGPTATCDFVATSEAVFVDVSGRYVSAPDQAAPRHIWSHLLDTLRHYRPAHPLTGIVLVVSAADLAGQPEEVLEASAATLRHRLDEIPKRLRARPPVYLVVSHVDRLVGFEAFFESAGREERERFWGVPIESDDEVSGPLDPAGRFAAGFASLVSHVSNRQMQRLQDEPDAHRRSLVYEFPNQLAALRGPVGIVLRKLTQPNRFDRPPFVRGVFLASAVQGSAPVDPLARGLARSFAQSPEALALREDAATGRSRSFFIPGLFRDLAFREAGAGRMSRRAWYASNQWRAVASAAAIVLTTVAGALVLSAYRDGTAHAELVETDALALAPQIGQAVPAEPARLPFSTVLAVLDRVAELDRLGEGGADRHLLSTSELGEATGRTYAQTLERLLLPWLQSRLALDLADPATGSAALFQELKLYLVLGGARPPAAVDLDGMAPVLARRWLGEEPGPEQSGSLPRHLEALRLSGFAPIALDESLVTEARRRIEDVTLARLVYDLAMASPPIASLPAWRPSDNMSAAGPLVLARHSGSSIFEGVAGPFTRAPFLSTTVPAFETVAARLSQDAWVLGEEDALRSPAERRDRLLGGALELLRADIVRAWDTFLSDLSVVRPGEPGAGAQLLARLIEPRSPIAELMAAAAAQTDLDRPAADPAAVAGTLLQAVGAGDPRGPGAAVTDHFAEVRQATAAAGPDQPSQVQSVLRGFEPLYRQLNLVASGGAVQELGTTLQPTADAITTAVEQLPPALQPFFIRLRDAALDVAVGTSRSRLQDIWASTVLPACRAATEGRFPFTPGAGEDTPIGDFAALFGPQGQIAGFRDTYLAPYVDTSVRPWTWRAASATDLGFDPAVLRAFEHADTITRAFFAEGDTPLARFSAEVASLTPNARSMRLDMGGTTLAFAHGPSTPVAAQWPPATPGAPAALTMLPEIEGGPNMISGQGPWAFFRVLGRARALRMLGDNTVQAAFDLGPRRAFVNFTAATATSPFQLGLLDRFRCPEFG